MVIYYFLRLMVIGYILGKKYYLLYFIYIHIFLYLAEGNFFYEFDICFVFEKFGRW